MFFLLAVILIIVGENGIIFERETTTTMDENDIPLAVQNLEGILFGIQPQESIDFQHTTIREENRFVLLVDDIWTISFLLLAFVCDLEEN